MPAPYTDAEQDALIDQLLADYAALEARVDTIEATLAIIEPAFTTAQADIAALQTDSSTHGTNITGLQSRVDTLETSTVPAVDTLQDDVTTLKVGSKARQENDRAELGKSQVVLRPSIERVRRPDGRIVQRTTLPR